MHVNPDLTYDQKEVLFNRGTEAPGTGKFLNHTEAGVYTCANCGSELFMSDSKYDSKTPGLVGWPSFSAAASNKALELKADDTFGIHRTEVTCATCGGHLGHLFEADDSPSGQHYCINSVCLGFRPQK